MKTSLQNISLSYSISFTLYNMGEVSCTEWTGTDGFDVKRENRKFYETTTAAATAKATPQNNNIIG